MNYTKYQLCLGHPLVLRKNLMNTSNGLSRVLVLLCLLLANSTGVKGDSWSVSWANGFKVWISADKNYKHTNYRGYVDIGRRASIDAGNRASIRMLSRLIRKYPRASYWSIDWSTVFRGKIVKTNTYYVRDEETLQRGYIRGAKNLDNSDSGENLSGITEEVIHKVALKAGGFADASRLRRRSRYN